MTFNEVRLQTVVREVREAIDPGDLDHQLVEHYSIPALEATGEPDIIPPDEILSNKQVLRGGEIMLSRLNPRKARVLRVPDSTAHPAIASGEFVIMEATDIDGDYLVYSLLSEEVRQHLHSCVQSVTRSHQRIRPEHLLKMSLRIPKRDTQEAIVVYLDSETTKIDSLIAKKQQLIERLAEYRTALITRTVTRGLPPDAAKAAGLDPAPPLKASGVEWLGDVPEHWAVRRLGRVGSFFKGGGGTKADEVEGGVPCVRYGDLYTQHQFLIKHTRAGIAEDATGNYRRLRYGDVLFAGSGETIEEIGKSAVNLIEGSAYCGGDVIVFRPAIKVDAAFLGYAGDCHPSIYQKACMGRGVTVMHIYSSELKQLVIPLPPLREQEVISAFLDRQMESINVLSGRVETAIERLQEYRTALITAAVTGKIDVRDREPVTTGARV